jgi:hypothetical protein
MDHEFILLPQGGKIPEQESHMTQSKNLVLTIVCNPCGFHLINVLEKWHKSNAMQYVTEMFSPLCE